MATAQPSGHRHNVGKLPGRLSAKNFIEGRRHLLEEDLNAGYQIPAILTGIILFGLLSMVLSVLAIILSGTQ